MIKKVIVRIKGGLGNQLFCYAAARRLALKSDAELVIDDVTGFIRDVTYRRSYALDRFQILARKAKPHERMEPFERFRRGLAKMMARHRPFRLRRYVEQEGIDFDPRLLSFKVKGTVYLDGLWQSEGYFKDVADVIRADLCIMTPTDQNNNEMAARIHDCLAVAVHVRWFDAPWKKGVNNATNEYYSSAIAHMEEIAPKAHYFLFSDDPASARARVPIPRERVTCVSHNQGYANAYADLWLMSQCNNFIIANSTFSWWGAWLGERKDKIVVCPKIKTQEGKKIAWNLPRQIPRSWRLLY